MNRLRKLSTIEATLAYQHALLQGNTQATTLLSLNGLWSFSAMHRAFEQLFGRYAMLQTCIVADDTELWFHEHADFLRIAVTQQRLDRSDASPLSSLLEAELNRLLDPGHALWRVHIVSCEAAQQTHVFLTRHHAVSDAFTTHHLLSEWLQLLAHGGTSPSVVVPLSAGADALTFRQARPRPASAAKPGSEGPSADLSWPHTGETPVNQRTTGVATIEFERDTSIAILKGARSLGFSLNTACAASWAKSCIAAGDRRAVTLFTALSLRARSASTTRIAEVGCYIDTHGCVLPGSLGFVELAQYYQTSLDDAATRLAPVQASHAAIRDRVRGLARSTAFQGIGLTNMGRIDSVLITHGIPVTRVQTLANRSGGLAAAVLHVCALAERLYLSVAYTRELISAQTIQQISNLLERELRAVAGAGEH